MQLTDLKFVTIETFVIQFVLLLVVLFVLNKFVFQPYLAYLDELEEKQTKLEADYKNIDKLVKDAEGKSKKILTDARKKWNSIVDEAKTLGKQSRETMLETAEKEAKDIVEASKVEIKQQELAMMSSMKSKVVDLTLRLNEKLFQNEKVSKDFLEKNIDSI